MGVVTLAGDTLILKIQLSFSSDPLGKCPGVSLSTREQNPLVTFLIRVESTAWYSLYPPDLELSNFLLFSKIIQRAIILLLRMVESTSNVSKGNSKM